jgi:hypothetical protein
MKATLLGKLAALALVVGAVSAEANPGLKLGSPDHGGTACPQGTVSATVSPDGNEVSILFDQYVVEAGGITGKSLDRKSCNLAIPVYVPQGYSVSIFQVDYRGFSAIPRGGRGQFNIEYFFAGSRGLRANKLLPSGVQKDYLLTDRLEATALVWSACGASTNLRINTSLLVATNSSRQDAMATLDSIDVSNGLVYHIQWKRCN